MSLSRNRDFTVFLSVQALSVAGDSFSTLAIPLLILHETGSVVQMGVLTGLSGAASLVAGMFAGHLADRLDRRRPAAAGICSQSFRQEVTPSHLLGRVTAAFWTIHYALGPAGAALLTLGASHLGVPTVAVIAAFGCVAVSLSGLLTPIRRRPR